MSRRSWSESYPPIQERPTKAAWPAWYHVPMSDLAECIQSVGLDLNSIKSIIDLGSGDGRRTINAILHSEHLNRHDVHVVCVEHAANAVMWGIDLWSRVRQREVVSDFEFDRSIIPKWSMEFREEDALNLPSEFLKRDHDLVIDWMFLHGLPPHDVSTYFRTIETLRPKYYLLKCFSKEGSSLSILPRAVHDVEKKQWSQVELMEILGDKYTLLSPPRQCPEDLRPLHPDGPIAAKREYCFVRK